MAALLAVVGCAQQEDLVSADLGAVNAPEFEVGFESSRVFIDETDGVFKLAWTQGDLLSCFLNTGGQAQYRFEGETGADNGIIKAVNCPSGEAIDAFYAIYPYNEANALADGILTVTLPAEQDYAVGTFAPNANTMVSINAAKEPYYTFSNVCGFIRLKVYGEASITSIEFKGNNEEVIAGVATVNPASENKALTIAGEGKTITLNCGEGVTLGATEAEATEFWLVVPPMPFDEGFTVTLTDAEGNSMEKKLDKDFTVERNKVHDGVIAYEVKPAVVVDPNLLFDAQFNENGTATDGGKFGMTIQRMVDENGATPNMSTAYDSKLQRNVVTFTHVPTNPVNDTTPNLNHSYYLVDFSENAEFEAAITDGYTFEILTYRVEPIAGNTVWSFPFAFGAESVANGGWGVFHNSRGASWTPTWHLFSGTNYEGLWQEPAMEQYEHLIISCDAEGYNTVYENGVLRSLVKSKNVWKTSTSKPLNLLEDHKCFAIGGMPLNGGICREYYGQVAMIRIYDNLMTAQEAMARCNELNLPARYGDVVFDVKFNNGSVSDAGIYQLPIKTVGEPTIDNGVLTLSNPAGATNQYIVVDASAQWNEIYNLFKSGGFTFETVIARTSADAEGAPFSIGSTGDNVQGYRLQALAGENHFYKSWSWQNVLMTDEAGLHTAVAELGKFYHVVAKYEGGARGEGCFNIYVNGEFVAHQQQTWGWGLAMNQNFTSQLFGIGAMPKGAYDTVTGALGFDGKIAVARLYGDNLPAHAIRARYNELKPTIDALNAK